MFVLSVLDTEDSLHVGGRATGRDEVRDGGCRQGHHDHAAGHQAEGEGGGGRGLEVGQSAVGQDRPGGLEEEEEGEEGVEEVADGEVEEEDVAGGGETETAGGQQQDEVGHGGRQEEEVQEEGRACKILHN